MTQGIYSFPGIVFPKHAIYSQSHGTDPDRIALTFVAQEANIAAGGTCIFFMDGTAITLPQCKVDQGSFEFNEAGFKERAILFDRRWMWWQVEKRSFHWNEVLEDGQNIRPVTEKTPQDILIQLFEWCGEGTVNVAAVPNLVRPEVVGDCKDPAAAINDLCDMLGCRVILGYGSATVSVVPINSGAALPNDGTVSRVSIGWNPPEVPQYVEVRFDPTVYQTRFVTEPVGMDTEANDYEIKLLDDLSYTPAEGWAAYANVEQFADLSTTEEQVLAERSVWRWFRIQDGNFTGVTGIPGYEHPETASTTVEHQFQVLPLFSTRASTDLVAQVLQMHYPRIWGEIWVDSSKQSQEKNDGVPDGENTTRDEPIALRFSVDNNNGILMFDREIRKNDAGTNVDPSLVVEIAHHVRNADTWEKDCYTKLVEVDPNGFGTVTVCIHDQRVVIGEYNTDHELTGFSDNTADLDTKAEEFVDAYKTQLAAYEQYVVTYNRLRLDIKPSGKISQVTHIVSDTGHGCVTVGGQHMEWDTGAKTYRQKRRVRAIDAVHSSIGRALRLQKKGPPRDTSIVR